MELLIIGHSVLDYIEYNGNLTIQPGGIFYTAAGFVSQKQNTDNLRLVTSLDGINDKYFSAVYSQLDLSYSEQTSAIPVVYLKIWNNKEREETFENFTGKLMLRQINNFSIFDGILINMISGNDIFVDDLVNIRQKFKGIIFIDIHALSKGVSNNRKRILRKVPQLKKWLSAANIIQVNEFELNTISEGKNQFERAEFVLNNGPEILIITKGESGVRAFFKNENETASVFLPAEKVKSVNTVGCGDIFGAFFFYTYIASQNLVFALRAANKAAAIATTYNSTKNFLNLKNDFFK